MAKRIGFTSADGALVDEVVQLVFNKKRGEQPINSTRYACELKAGHTAKSFDLYLPNLLIKGEAPKRLLVVIKSLD
jgi:hypothetical protein